MQIVDLRRCNRCIMPETQENIVFDEEGICGACRQNEVKSRIDWKAKEKQLIKLLAQYKGKFSYDCLIPFSGGKDSTYTAYALIKKYGIKPLLVTFDHGFLRPRMLENRIKTVKKMGVDILTFRANWKTTKRLMIEGLKRRGDFCWPCHTGVFSYPMQVAIKFNVPLVFWGEPNAEYNSYYSYETPEEVNEARFNRIVNLGLTAGDMLKFLGDSVDKRDLEPYTYPSLRDLTRINYRSLCLGSYIPWDPKKQAEIIRKELDWQWDSVEGIPEDYGYQKIECMLYGVRDYLLFIKKGFGRTAHLTSMDIRSSRLSREEALKLAREFDGKKPASLSWFLEILDLSEAEFMNIALKHISPPHVFNSRKLKTGKKLWDQDLWDRTR